MCSVLPDFLEVNVLSVNQLMQNGADVSFKEFHAHLSVGKTKSYFARGIDGRLVWPLEPDRTEAKRRRNGVRSTIKKRLPEDLSARSNPVSPQVIRHADQEPMGGQPHEQVGVSPEDVHAAQSLPEYRSL